MISLVLCGGLSSRMGTDKGLIAINALNWAQYQRLKLLEFTDTSNAFISINPNQVETYSSYFTDQQLIVDIQTIEGPMRGIFSAHLKYPNSDILVLACDMIDIPTACIALLLDSFRQKKMEVTLFVQPSGQEEPLFAIYSSVFLKRLVSLFYEGQLAKNSMKYCLSLAEIHYLPISIEQIPFFANYNKC